MDKEERDTALVEFFTEQATALNYLLDFTDKDFEFMQRTKIGEAVLQDVTPSALAALNQIAYLFPANLVEGKALMKNQLLDLLVAEAEALAAEQ